MRNREVLIKDKPLIESDADSMFESEPRWHAVVALLLVGALYPTLPASLAFLPRPVFPAIAFLMLIPLFMTKRLGKHRLNQIFGFILNIILTVFLVFSVTFLAGGVINKTEDSLILLRSAAILWTTNIIVFALWYWRLDAGGPHKRESRPGHPDGAFLFPQMSLDDSIKDQTGETCWSPNFIDYLFLSFNTSTALSPTDAPVLSRWAKLLMMLQSLISLTIIVLFAARAVNIL